MLFNSINFLIFFPIVTLLYFIFPHKIRWVWLLVSSYYFYMSWNVKYALLISVSIFTTYISGLLIDMSKKLNCEKKRNFQRKLWVALSFSSNISILFFFKYFDFAVININRVLSQAGIQVLSPSFDVLLPVGISFYTFQALSYTMDVYRGDIYAEKNIAKYALYVSFFPLLIAGPIERAKNLLVQVNERHYFDYECIKNGLLLMTWGYFQKVVIADNISAIVNTVFNDYANYSGVLILIAAIFFGIQIYCDFSGYSDIAIGAAQIMGFKAMENFKRPYFAVSVQDFWRRWHISLSTWFRDYLYIPLGGSRCSKLKKYRNIMITFLVSGLWHGASWNFVVWGGLHGSFQIIGEASRQIKENIYKKLKINTKSAVFKFVQIFITFMLVDFAWIFFRAPSMRTALSIIKTIFTNFGLKTIFDGSLFESVMSISSKNFLAYAVVPMLVLFAANSLQSKINIRQALSNQHFVIRWTAYYIILFSILILGEFGVNQFLYFQF